MVRPTLLSGSPFAPRRPTRVSGAPSSRSVPDCRPFFSRIAQEILEHEDSKDMMNEIGDRVAKALGTLEEMGNRL
jgi:hypothetical protein